ncbi:MAG: 1-(5-phosphoribosyl)-5-[(5-phosphoribosylamino)methylideneamino] imidazole-4-carboxamide isomerase [Deltaproteobacteria bacterium]|jgi:phosphoribosylformimino-5-aminoimidazole carboxamide ribotide isomerase|nr:1-(5-phosphoribosyl)-5-[(5-phosphoribosylamino)methylideneamino] imidazole-4-carboxamide isomerase [Deltaproteobacteria bacterium]
MYLFPAIDLKEGHVVRLVKGLFNSSFTYGTDPVAMAQRWAAEGATWLHLVDLDASLGKTTNREIICAIRQSVNLKIQLGGGLKDLDTLKFWVDAGINRLILGTLIVENPKMVEKAASLFPGLIAAALDSQGHNLRTWGWQKDGGQDLIKTAASLKDRGVSVIIHTDTERDGTLTGPNLPLTLEVARVSHLPTILSGGISRIEDLISVKNEAPELYGVITGKAIYENKFTVAKAIDVLADS